MLKANFLQVTRKNAFHVSRIIREEITGAEGPIAQVSKLSKDQLKKRELRRFTIRKREAKMPATSHPLYMQVPQALRFLRAAEVGQPLSQQTINLTTLVVSEKGSPNLAGDIAFVTPLKEVKIAIFTNDETQMKIAKEKFNCYVVGGSELISKIKNGEIEVDFDKAFATPDIVQELGSVARILGPRGVFPSIKKGTVSENVEDLIKGNLGSIPFRQLGNCISVAIGKCNFSDRQILENLISVRKAFKDSVSTQKTKKPSILGKTILSTTHGPGIVIDFS
ncbi:hypothetical protein TPHA_0J00770 [Tetrapisispora phaffii CBS 4417]|uniref:Ribosomal protein n=1 Tax=Tetrapisispora phaffii (strain ATCC 24235 / CBS 4417 / NBRC 1672 / NRRL Y-8282 / UCD 70-5) TaxID=1071381 RepID=G8BYF8_TETPH|nr:mitochondrial 54S ribosomal protein MRPL1 TPHA_0J00770 [Tetrapisispora phaffii CBS 4417]CCE64900.1 hypothetical protein TPHA_0J00770 [Tetrapisispora phaffii CBS 4417]